MRTELDRPIFVVGPPRSGQLLLIAALARAAGVVHLPRVLDGAELPFAELVDREGRAPEGAVRAVVAAAEVAAVASAFPGALFVYLVREAAESVAALEGEDPDADPEDVVERWRAAAEDALDALEGLTPERWSVVELAALLAAPRDELRRLCAFLDLPYDQALLTPVEEAARSLAHRPPAPSAELAQLLPRAAAAAARARDLVADPPTETESPRPRPTSDSPFRSVSTASFVPRLARLGASLLVSTYQTGKVVVVRTHEGRLNTHFRNFDKPMGMALATGRLALGTRTEVWDFRDMPAVGRRLEPPGRHDACFVPRNRHVTGDIAIHEMAFAQGELWVVATAFSCLATLDAHHSFVPRWRPPFVTELRPEDRCHLNGLAVVDDRVRYVSALGTSDEPGGWRAGKAAGGVIMEVPSGEVVAAGLSMPHSPRWHNERLWVLESGRGELCQVDLDRGRSEPVLQLPGFARGMAMVGRLAFVGLSQIRESSTFGDLPITERLQERMSGVWVVDLGRGEIEGFLRFDDLVQEVFDVALVQGRRFPEIATTGDAHTASAFVLP